MGCGEGFNITRRELLKLTLLSAFAPTSIKKANAVAINPLDFVNLIDFKCLSCDVDLLGCMKIDLDGVHFAPRINYWMPVGFVESGLAFEFGKAFPMGEIVSNLLRPLMKIIAPFIPSGTYGIFQGTGFQNYMKLYPHWYGFPPVVKQAIKTAILAINSLNPICLSCKIADAIIDSVVPARKIIKEINDKLNELGLEKLKKLKSFKEKLDKIQNIYNNAFKVFPIFPSELLFFIWTIEEFNIDNKTIAPALVGAIQAIQKTIPEIGVLTCPYLTRYIGKHFNLPFGVDFDFICVGYWGYGYPRMGIVRHDDPVVANLLAIARFHHFFSKTLPLIDSKFSFENIKYQMFSPIKASCFTPGYKASDISADILYQAGNLDDIKQYVTNPSKIGKDLGANLKDRGISAITSILKQRTVGLVVWQRFSKCCW